MKKNLVVIIALTLIIGLLIFVMLSHIQSKSNEQKREQYIEFIEPEYKNIAEIFENTSDNNDKLEFVKSVDLGASGYLFMLDNEYNIIYHPKQDLIGLNISETPGEVFFEPLQELKNETNEVLFIYNYNGLEKISYFYMSTDGTVLAILDNTDDYECVAPILDTTN